MRHRHYRTNPAVGVTNQIINRSLPWLRTYVNNPKLLPNIGEHLGCGSFGCVYGTGIPEIVVKVTCDERRFGLATSEFTHIRAIEALIPEQPIPGLAFFYDVTLAPHELDSDWYFIWRERVERVGRCPADLLYLTSDVQDYIEAGRDRWSPTFAPRWRTAFVDLHRKYPNIAEGFLHCLELGKCIKDVGNNNIGWNGSEWVIFDPMFSQISKDRADMLLEVIENA